MMMNAGCGANGEGCTMVETTLVNPTSPGSGSSTDITLISPYVLIPSLNTWFMLNKHNDLATPSPLLLDLGRFRFRV